jgi:putative FmdB family regulatory protein
MPTYVYRREDGTTFEITQSIKDDAITTCPTTGQAVTRVISSGTGLIFKGSGFYQTDYVRKPGGTPADKATSDANGSASTPSAESSSQTDSETKPKPEGKSSD